MGRDPLTMPVVRVEFRCADGEVIRRDWTTDEGPPKLTSVPDWLENPSRSWAHPQEPVTFRGDVKPGWEAEAREFALGGTPERETDGD